MASWVCYRRLYIVVGAVFEEWSNGIAGSESPDGVWMCVREWLAVG